MKIFLDSIGCRLNQSEIEKMALQFRAAGHEIVGTPGTADLVVVNTCAVTAAASSDSRQRIHQAALNGKTRIIATGCWATVELEKALQMPNVTDLVTNNEKDLLVSRILKISPEKINIFAIKREPLPGSHQRTRAFIKVQDGCNNFCTFCITRVARGPSRSMPFMEIMADIQAAMLGGAKEIVLTGAQLGSWGRDLTPICKLADLINKILETCEIPRLRLSSLEPWEVDKDLLALLSHPRFCHHLHLPLQSGSEIVLKRMARKINPKQYSTLLKKIREKVPEIAITTDIIVGFPGETDDEFNSSLEFVNNQQFAAGHVFSFSARPGTPAANFTDSIHIEIRKNRSRLMRVAVAESAQKYRKKFKGLILQVLWEKATKTIQGDWIMEGLSPNYLRVRASSNRNLWNTISNVELLSYDDQIIEGRILN